MSTTRSEKILRKKSTNFSAKMVLREWSIKWPVSKRSSAFTTWRSSLPTSEHAPPPRDRGSRCHDLNSNRCRRNISGRRNPKVSLSTRPWRGQNVLAGCGAHRGCHELGRGEIIPIQLPPSQGVRTAKLRGFFRLCTQPAGHQIFGAASHDQFLSGGT